MDDSITTSFSPLIGLPCWGVDKMQGSTLSFEFGDPHLHVREPMTSTSESASIRARMARRNVKPVGAWHLWIAMCNWQVLSHGQVLADEEADDEAIRAALRELDGQKLTGLTLDALQATTTFDFDLGGTLATRPYEANHEEQWSLYMPDAHVLSYRSDGCFSVAPSILKPGDIVWRSLPSEPQTYRVGSAAPWARLS